MAAQFYRRQLPASCVDFSSELGKKIFTETLLAGNSLFWFWHFLPGFANIYFKLAAQFRTQDDPAYCGLSTLGAPLPRVFSRTCSFQ